MTSVPRCDLCVPRQGFELVLLPPDASSADDQEPYAWLLQHLPAVPNFSHLRQGAIHGLRIACHVSLPTH